MSIHQEISLQNSEAEAARTEFEAKVAALASHFHENWRQTRLQEDGSYDLA